MHTAILILVFDLVALIIWHTHIHWFIIASTVKAESLKYVPSRDCDGMIKYQCKALVYNKMV